MQYGQSFKVRRLVPVIGIKVSQRIETLANRRDGADRTRRRLPES